MKSLVTTFFSLAAILLPAVLHAATPEPGYQPSAILFRGARIVVKPGQVIEQGDLLTRRGVIVDVGQSLTAPADTRIVNAQGLSLYAGLIDAASSRLIDEKAKPTAETPELPDQSRHAYAGLPLGGNAKLTAAASAATLLEAKSDNRLAYRKQGFSVVHVVPVGRVVSGEATLLSTAEAPAVTVRIPCSRFSSWRLFAPGGNDYPSTLMGATANLRQSLLDARWHTDHTKRFERGDIEVGRPQQSPTLDTLSEVLEGSVLPIFRFDSRDDWDRSVVFASEFELQPVMWGGDDIGHCLDRIKKQPILLTVNFGERPAIEDDQEATEDTEKNNATQHDKTDTAIVPSKTPLRVRQERLLTWQSNVRAAITLHEQGVPFAFSSEGLKDPSELIKQVRVMIEEGLPVEAAVAALTESSARILGCGSRLGTLEPGRLAHVVAFSEPLESKSAQVRYLLIEEEFTEWNAPSPNDDEQKGSDSTDAPGKTPSAADTAPPLSWEPAGSWRVVVESAQGPVAGELSLQLRSKSLTGRFSSPHGSGRVTNATGETDRIRFSVEIGAGAEQITLEFEGQHADGKLHGTLKSAFGERTKWSAIRDTTTPPAASGKAEEASKGPPLTLSLEIEPKTRSTGKQTPATATKPGELPDPAETAAANSTGERPTELDSDRFVPRQPPHDELLLRKGTIWAGVGKTLTAADILVKGGRIAAIGEDLAQQTTANETTRVIDCTNRFIMPGIIDTHSHIMITGGVNEATDSIVAEVRVQDVVRTDDVAEYRAVAGGVTTARLLHGSANVIGGQDAIVKLRLGRSPREHLLENAPIGVKFALGENVKYRRNRFPNTRMGVEATLQRAFYEAVDYRRSWQQYHTSVEQKGVAKAGLPPRRDLRLEALADIVNHEKFIHAHCYRADEILMLLRVADQLGFRVWSLQHVLEGYKVAAEIVAHGASCSTFADWWAYKVEAFDATPYNAALLQEAGANVVIKSDDAELIRHLYYEAAKPVHYGDMAIDDALRTVTANPARELGILDRVGTIEVGKDADLAIFNGHPLNSFSRCEMTIIDGKVMFDRSQQPSCLTAEARERSQGPHLLERASRKQRRRIVSIERIENRDEYAIVDAILHPVDAPLIERGQMLIRDGRIAAIGAKVDIPDGVPRLKLSGLHVYPGLIDSGTMLGLVEIRKVVETHDHNESGEIQPDLRTVTAVNADSELIPVARAGGITTALIRPSTGIIAGQAGVIQLAGWTAPEMVLEPQAGLQLHWPTGKNATEERTQLNNFIEQAQRYLEANERARSNDAPELIRDPRLLEMKRYLAGERPVLIEANSEKGIIQSLNFCEKHGLRPIITGGADAWKVVDELHRRDVPVIVGPVMQSPTEREDPHDAPYANPGRLHAAGVRFCIRSDDTSNSRNVPFEAAMAVAFGLPEEVAVRAVTLSAAEILGLADELGSLTVGKRADFIVADGSPLQITSQNKLTVIAGRPFRPESRQTKFYERYARRLESIQEERDEQQGRSD